MPLPFPALAYPFVHLPECTPLSPAACCRAAEFLRAKLPPEDLEKFIAVMGGDPLVPKVPLEAPVEVLFDDLPPRVRNTLRRSNIATIADLIEKTEGELLKMPFFGAKGIRLLKKALQKVGHTLARPPQTETETRE